MGEARIKQQIAAKLAAEEQAKEEVGLPSGDFKWMVGHNADMGIVLLRQLTSKTEQVTAFPAEDAVKVGEALIASANRAKSGLVTPGDGAFSSPS